MLLLKKLGASEEEQIAGLLHDVSHTAFSHLVDWVVGQGGLEDFQDNHHCEIIKKSKIPAILEKYSYTVERILNYEHFSLLEQNAPDLCADRVDYSLREFVAKDIETCLDNLRVHNGKIVMANRQSARVFANGLLFLQESHWGNFRENAEWIIFANALRRAIDLELVKLDDFWKNEDFVMAKIKKTQDPEIKRLVAILQKSVMHLPLGEKRIYKKFRYVDPLFLNGNKLFRLSEVDKDFKERIEKAREKNAKGLLMPKI